MSRQPFRIVPVLGLGLALLSLAGPGGAFAAVPAPTSVPNPVLSKALRSFLVNLLPNPLYEASPGWGKTAPVLTGFKWKGKGLRTHLAGKKSPRNHGTWRKIRVTTNPNTVVVELRDIKQEPGRT